MGLVITTGKKSIQCDIDFCIFTELKFYLYVKWTWKLLLFDLEFYTIISGFSIVISLSSQYSTAINLRLIEELRLSRGGGMSGDLSSPTPAQSRVT